MKMNKMFTGLIALVAGVALSAGSAFATAGYVGGDPAQMKLVPYFETGENKATIIGIQNMSPQEADTMERQQKVTDIQAFLDGGMITMVAQEALVAEGATDSELVVDTTTFDEMNLNLKAQADAALEKAMMAVQTEHLFVAVNVYDAMGMMMEDASASLCLAENQFGYVILQGFVMQSWQEHIPFRSAILSVPDGDIPAYGYAEIVAENMKFSGCEDTSRTERIVPIVTADADGAPETVDPAQSKIAAWTIIQDTGGGFFGTEVPTSTISKSMTAADATTSPPTAAGDPMLACHSEPTAAPVVANRLGNFMQGQCGLIPERHRIMMTEGVLTVGTGNDADATPRAHAFARYDAGDESMVYVWLAEGMDTEATKPKDARMLDVVVKCEGGMVMTGMDQYGDATPSIKVAAPGMVTMIDPTMGDVGEATDMCEGDRGVLQITMPNGSYAGMVFSHISQLMGHYRMNFPGYSAASPDDCADMDACMAP